MSNMPVSPVDDALFATDRWVVREVRLTQPKIDTMWELIQRHRSLFSDITRGNKGALLSILNDQSSMWFEIIEADVIVGFVYFNELHQVTDCNAHMVFLDRRPAEKAAVCRQLTKWMFQKFPLHRMTVTPPVIYYGTVRLVERIGFRREGTKRESVLMGGRWLDQAMLGITRAEVEAM